MRLRSRRIVHFFENKNRNRQSLRVRSFYDTKTGSRISVWFWPVRAARTSHRHIVVLLPTPEMPGTCGVRTIQPRIKRDRRLIEGGVLSLSLFRGGWLGQLTIIAKQCWTPKAHPAETRLPDTTRGWPNSRAASPRAELRAQSAGAIPYSALRGGLRKVDRCRPALRFSRPPSPPA